MIGLTKRLRKYEVFLSDASFPSIFIYATSEKDAKNKIKSLIDKKDKILGIKNCDIPNN